MESTLGGLRGTPLALCNTSIPKTEEIINREKNVENVEFVELRGGKKVGGQMKRFVLERVRLRMSGRGRGMVEGTVEQRTELGRGKDLSCG